MYLTVSHLIFLTKEERYSLIDGNDINVIGVSLPVWVKGKETSNPANEIFCRYILGSRGGDVQLEIFSEGYRINLPRQELLTQPKNTSLVEDLVKRLKEISDPVPSVNALKDIREGGAEYYRFNAIMVSTDLKIVHHIEIKTMDTLEKSLY